MKISIDSREITTLNTHKKDVIKNDIPVEIFDMDMQRRIIYWVKDNLFGKAMNILKKRWSSILRDRGIADLPTGDSDYAALLLTQPEFSQVPEVSQSIVSVDDVDLFTIPADMKKIISYYYNKVNPDQYIAQQIVWLMNHKYERCMERVRLEWEPKLKAEGVKTVKSDNTEFYDGIKARPDCKDRSDREREDPKGEEFIASQLDQATKLLNRLKNQ